MYQSVFRRIVLGTILSLELASCGFTPVHAPGSQVGMELSNIVVAPPKQEVDYLFVRVMEERLGRNANAEKILKYDISIYQDGVESVADRYNLIGTVSYKLALRDDTKRVVEAGEVDSFTSYAVSSELYTASQRDARERLVVILADKLIADLTIKMASQ